MFAITHNGTGFRIKFANDWTVSVQFSRFNYCEHKRDIQNLTPEEFVKDPKNMWGGGVESWESKDAEIAVISPTGKFLTADDTDHGVAGWQTTDQMLAIMNWAAAQPAPIKLDATVTSGGKQQ